MPQTQANPHVERHMGRWVPIFGALLIIVILALVLFWFQSSRIQGTVTVMVRGLDDTRSVQTLSLSSRALTERPDVNPNEITTISARTFQLSDGSIIMLDTPGVVRYDGERNSSSVLIASPVQPLLRTPLSVWKEGLRVAWMSPADGSIQVFEKNARGAYLPIYLNTELKPNSLGFTDDGTTLVATLLKTETTEVYAISLPSEKIQKITTIDGLASIVPTP